MWQSSRHSGCRRRARRWSESRRRPFRRDRGEKPDSDGIIEHHARNCDVRSVCWHLSAAALRRAAAARQGWRHRAAFGGSGSQAAFGARAGATVLTRATTVLGALFMVGAIVLAIPGRTRSRFGPERRRRTAGGTGGGRTCRGSAGRASSGHLPRGTGLVLGPLNHAVMIAEVAELADAPA